MRCGAYVHIPFCSSKCGYCDFVSYAGLEGLYGAYANALILEIANRAKNDSRKLDTIYFGGGTPSVVDAVDLARILATIEDCYRVDADAEVSVEVNPETASKEMLSTLIEAGFNRLSIGVQSFDDEVLISLGRKADAGMNRTAIENARDIGFANINIDLIYGVKGQSLASWNRTLSETIDIGPEHVSAYCLTVSPRAAVAMASEGDQVEMMMAAREMLTKKLVHYETSNFSYEGFSCRHNLIYWKNEDYLGFGAGAHSHDGRVRSWNVANPSKYIERVQETGNAAGGREDTSQNDEMADTVYMGFRLSEGLDLADFKERFKIDFKSAYREQLSKAEQDGFICIKDSKAVLTEKGRLFADAVAVDFM